MTRCNINGVNKESGFRKNNVFFNIGCSLFPCSRKNKRAVPIPFGTLTITNLRPTITGLSMSKLREMEIDVAESATSRCLYNTEKAQVQCQSSQPLSRLPEPRGDGE